jgi:hypothetical protein
MLIRSSMFWSSSNWRRSRLTGSWSVRGSPDKFGGNDAVIGHVHAERIFAETHDVLAGLAVEADKTVELVGGLADKLEVMRMVNLTEKSHRDWKDGLHAGQKVPPSSGTAAAKGTAMHRKKTEKN